jgi:uncharacterized membrane-anchored protein
MPLADVVVNIAISEYASLTIPEAAANQQGQGQDEMLIDEVELQRLKKERQKHHQKEYVKKKRALMTEEEKKDFKLKQKLWVKNKRSMLKN